MNSLYKPIPKSATQASQINVVIVLFALLLPLLVSTVLIPHAWAEEQSNTKVPVSWHWDGTYPLLRLNTNAEITKRVHVDRAITFEDAVFWDDESSIENDNAISREIITHPKQGNASLGSVHYSAKNTHPGTYPFTVRYTSIWGQQIDVTYTAIVYTESVVDDIVDAITGGSDGQAAQARARLASTGVDLVKVLIMAAFAFTAFLACRGARHLKGRTVGLDSHILSSSL
ncbi:MAG: hypothetical protein LKF41_05365 [Bifidobacterium sp.]|jgi:hypothetical protein|nr:hypothetical protein [Bifidobacterium sp.]MCH4175270.1 hypothetical protein [Bifidobacterium sp.]